MAWFYAFLLFANTSIGVRAGFVRKQLGLGHRSSYRLCRMIRVHMATMARPEMLGGEGKTVHIDEVHLRYIVPNGGGRHESAIVLGFACEGQVLSGIIPDRRSATLIPQIVARVRPGSRIVTDMLSGYQRLGKLGFDHVMINHSVAFHDFRGNSNNEIEAYWSTVRRMMRASRQVSREHLWTFLAEIEFKYNRRHTKKSIFEEMVSHFPLIDVDNEDAELAIRRRFDWSSQENEDTITPDRIAYPENGGAKLDHGGGGEVLLRAAL